MVASGVRVISPDLKNPGGMIQEQAETTAVWSDAFCGAGLAAMFAWTLAPKDGWNDTKVERLLSGCGQYAPIASIADCVQLLDGTRTLARLPEDQLRSRKLRKPVLQARSESVMISHALMTDQAGFSC
jgi:hypothetical protein